MGAQRYSSHQAGVTNARRCGQQRRPRAGQETMAQRGSWLVADKQQEPRVGQHETKERVAARAWRSPAQRDGGNRARHGPRAWAGARATESLRHVHSASVCAPSPWRAHSLLSLTPPLPLLPPQ